MKGWGESVSTARVGKKYWKLYTVLSYRGVVYRSYMLYFTIFVCIVVCCIVCIIVCCIVCIVVVVLCVLL